ncbi:MAG TPA: hypothetical protein VJZ91_05780, partial [Blastocatellia bacterium]|nr:hypothetical protein [Blastocatellia bacterium]
ANAKAATEKVGDVEVTSYGNIAYAFVNHYLMMAANVASLRQALEARAGHTTLADDRNFQSYTEWQPRASVTQIYVSAGVLKGLIPNRPRTDDRMDQETKEFLARYHFDPEPITFAASAEGVGAHYELRLPKRLLMRVFSEIAATEVASRMPRNEAITRGFLQSFQEYEKSYKTRHGKYATLDEMIANDKSSESSAQKYAGVGFYKQMIEQSGYRLEVTATAGGYEVTATPTEYGKTGRLSFYTDQTGVVREGDHQGKPASSSDKPAGKN